MVQAQLCPELTASCWAPRGALGAQDDVTARIEQLARDGDDVLHRVGGQEGQTANRGKLGKNGEYGETWALEKGEARVWERMQTLPKKY